LADESEFFRPQPLRSINVIAANAVSRVINMRRLLFWSDDARQRFFAGADSGRRR